MSPVYSFSDFRIPRASPAFVGIRKKSIPGRWITKSHFCRPWNPEMQGLPKVIKSFWKLFLTYLILNHCNIKLKCWSSQLSCSSYPGRSPQWVIITWSFHTFNRHTLSTYCLQGTVYCPWVCIHVESVCVLDGVVREGLSDKSTCVQRPEWSERMSHEDVESEGTASANALG